jgi:hypothetical protein
LAGRKAIFLLAAILIDAPVAGFRPIRADRALTCRIPRAVAKRWGCRPFRRAD